MKKNCTISIIHETRYVRTEDISVGEKDRKYPVKIRATFKINSEGKSKWVQKYFPVGHDLTEKEFEAAMGSPRTPELKEARREILDLQQKALKIVRDNDYLTPDLFASQYAGTGNLNNVIDFMKMMKKRYYDEDRIGTGDSFRDAIGSISDFVNPGRTREKRQDDEVSVSLMFMEVDEEWLKRYESWMKKRGRSTNTIGIYLRNLRTAFNLAASKRYRIISSDLYPFGQGGHAIKKQSKTKWAPQDQDKQNLFSFTTKNQALQMALDFGKFSYYMNGSNPADIARLKAGLFNDEYIYLDRTKTKNTEIDKKLITIYIHPEMRAIYQRWGNKTLNPDDYAFPIIRIGQTAKQQKEGIRKFIKSINEGLREIGVAVGLKRKLTFGIFRHIYGTTLNALGISIEEAQQRLGHSDPKTTKNYQHSFEEQKVKESSGLL